MLGDFYSAARSGSLLVNQGLTVAYVLLNVNFLIAESGRNGCTDSSFGKRA